MLDYITSRSVIVYQAQVQTITAWPLRWFRTITAKPLSISGTSVTKVYDGDTTATSGEVSVGTVSGKVGSENVTVSGTGTFAGDTVGTHNVSLVYSLSGDDAANYSLASEVVSGMITAKPLSVSGSSASKVYDGDTTATSDEVSVGTVGGKVGSENVTVSGTGTFAGDTVGTHNVSLVYSLSGADAANYSAPVDETVTAGGTINAKTLNIAGTLANDKTYDGTTGVIMSNNGTITAGDIEPGDTVTLASATGAFANKTVGNGKAVSVSYTLEGADAGNYTASGNAVTASISKKSLAVSGSQVQDKPYTGNTTATITVGAVSGKVSGDVLVVSGQGSFASADIGNNIEVAVTYVLSGADG